MAAKMTNFGSKVFQGKRYLAKIAPVRPASLRRDQLTGP